MCSVAAPEMWHVEQETTPGPMFNTVLTIGTSIPTAHTGGFGTLARMPPVRPAKTEDTGANAANFIRQVEALNVSFLIVQLATPTIRDRPLIRDA
jgi:hypothetical protein